MLLVLSLALGMAIPVGSAPVNVSRGQMDLPTYPWSAGKHPYFRGTDKVNIYPYPMLDFLSRDKTNRTYRTVVLENEYLRLTFLPELGGKIHEVIDKSTGQPMFYVNHVVKPGLIGQCGAWTSGGVEWNTGPQGHTVSAMQPVPVEILPPEKDGSRSVAIGETERIYGTRWTVIVTLRPGRSFIEERIRIYNPTETVRPYYFWNCTAVPNTPGFRFIYPMTLGTDHGSEKFFNWPIHEGKDLSRGTNYQDASSIFAWHCDQDFFGCYDDGVDRGVVSFANHHQVPGKKAWTWGQGGFGKMHQMDLTDNDGPYNEVQTGPLLTQGEVGRLDPCEAVEWKEWWYPVHGMGGFTFANKDVAISATDDGKKVHLRVLGTSSWKGVKAGLKQQHEMNFSFSSPCDISPSRPVELILDHKGMTGPFDLFLSFSGKLLAECRFPLDLPVRKPPEKKTSAETAAELAQAGWQDYLFARFPEAEAKFRKALEKDPKSVEAHTGLAYVYLPSDPESAAKAAQAAVDVNPHEGRARFALAVARHSIDEAWESSLDPAMAIPGRGLAARLSLGVRDPHGAIKALSETGPWQNDPTCRNLLGLAIVQTGQPKRAEEMAKANLATDPLDAFARSLLWVTGAKDPSLGLKPLLALQPRVTLDLVAEYANLGAGKIALRLLDQCYFSVVPKSGWDPLFCYWAFYLSETESLQSPHTSDFVACIESARGRHADIGFPDLRDSIVPVEYYGFETGKEDQESLYVGHLRFQQGRYAEG
ncbi:MAG: DUF5107 domain-containing protein, partial [Verrucomicrobia bacterium]|nr:DUF5107 domain-containing protein [Verrucomicrobiota bacterium]